jgi:hypothetical protein
LNCQHIYLFLSSSGEEVVVEIIVRFIRIMFIRQCSILYIVVFDGGRLIGIECVHYVLSFFACTIQGKSEEGLSM